MTQVRYSHTFAAIAVLLASVLLGQQACAPTYDSEEWTSDDEAFVDTLFGPFFRAACQEFLNYNVLVDQDDIDRDIWLERQDRAGTICELPPMSLRGVLGPTALIGLGTALAPSLTGTGATVSAGTGTATATGTAGGGMLSIVALNALLYVVVPVLLMAVSSVLSWGAAQVLHPGHLRELSERARTLAQDIAAGKLSAHQAWVGARELMHDAATNLHVHPYKMMARLGGFGAYLASQAATIDRGLLFHATGTLARSHADSSDSADAQGDPNGNGGGGNWIFKTMLGLTVLAVLLASLTDWQQYTNINPQPIAIAQIGDLQYSEGDQWSPFQEKLSELFAETNQQGERKLNTFDDSPIIQKHKQGRSCAEIMANLPDAIDALRHATYGYGKVENPGVYFQAAPVFLCRESRVFGGGDDYFMKPSTINMRDLDKTSMNEIMLFVVNISPIEQPGGSAGHIHFGPFSQSELDMLDTGLDEEQFAPYIEYDIDANFVFSTRRPLQIRPGLYAIQNGIDRAMWITLRTQRDAGLHTYRYASGVFDVTEYNRGAPRNWWLSGEHRTGDIRVP